MQWLPLIFAVFLASACLPALVRLLLPPLPPDEDDDAPLCVVVLGAGRVQQQGRQGLSARSLQRLEAGFSLALREKMPLLLSGGAKNGEGTSEAELMARELLPRAGQMEIWRETTSRNTHENAQQVAAELGKHGIQHVWLVTDHAHLCRALLCLRRHGISAKPVPADLFPAPDWLPHAGALALWPEIAYEWLALGWYLLQRRL